MTNENPVKQQAIAAEIRRFLQSQVTLASALTATLSEIQQSLIHWESRGYTTSLTDEDLAEYPFTAEQLTAFIGVLALLQQNAINNNWVSIVSPIAKSGS